MRAKIKNRRIKSLNELRKSKIITFSAAIKDNSLPIFVRNKLKENLKTLTRKK